MTWWQYLMLVNIYLLLFYAFYALLLSRETFFQLNRIYLVAAALLSFFIPMIQADWVRNLFITQKVQYTIYSSPVLNYRFTPVQDTHFTIGQLLAIIYLGGIMFLLARFAWQLLALRRIISRPAQSVAYSFFKQVKLGDEQEHRQVIAAHENVHARQWHSADVLIMEALMIVNWFNPVVYFYRFAIKHIHEFIADRQAVKSGTDKADYAMILLSQTFNTPAHQLVTPFFNKSLLKQRIIMLQKNKSQRVRVAKYFLSAPLFMLMLILSSATVNNSKAMLVINNKVEKVFLIAPGSQSGIKMTSYTVKGQNDASQKRQKASNPLAAADVILLNDTTPKKDGLVFTSVEQVPFFPGGVDAFMQFLAKNIRYPQEAREKNVQGKVIISFIVETDGTLTNFKVVRSVGSGTDEEAVRVLAMSPKWSPGLQNGHKVRVAYAVPINFTLSADEPGKENKKGAVDEDNGKNSNIVINQNAVPDTGKNSINNYLESPLFLSGNPPLYIVDDVQVDNLNILRPDDIQSISVLKDKTRTALYGEKGKNGVIIVTTKGYALKHKADVIIDKN